MKYPLTFYTTRFLEGNQAGAVRVILLPIIFIRPEYKDDRGLYEHELVHVKQAWSWIIPQIHAVGYWLSSRYRLQCEVEAYKEQAKHYAEDRKLLFAKFISEDYELGITISEALEKLND